MSEFRKILSVNHQTQEVSLSLGKYEISLSQPVPLPDAIRIGMAGAVTLA